MAVHDIVAFREEINLPICLASPSRIVTQDTSILALLSVLLELLVQRL